MGWLKDDFYSTKVSRRDEWRYHGRSAKRWALPGWALPAAGGAAVMAVLFLLFGGGGGSAQPDDAVLAAAAPYYGEGAFGAAEDSDPIVAAADKVSPAVVSILGTVNPTEPKEGSNLRSGITGLGSGVIYERAGNKVRVVTNNHVVEGYDSLDIITSAGNRLQAELIGRDQITDLAVLEIDGRGVDQVAEFGDSDRLAAGQMTIAIGNPLGLGHEPTVTFGIISQPKRTIPVSLGGEGGIDWEMDVIQTDAAINQGNSGGALVNLKGKVIGINTLKVSDMGVEGLGFAIPINEVKDIIEVLVRDKKVKRPYIGVVTQALQSFAGGTESLKLPKEVKQGVIVFETVGPAKAAGLKSGDVIVELDGKPIGSTLELRKYIYGSKQIGDKLEVTYYREGKRGSVTLTLEELKDGG